MSHVRERFWTPKLRSLVKKVVHRCDVCRGYRATPLKSTVTVNSQLPAFRAELSNPFIVTGVDFAGPVYHEIGKNKIEKAYIALFTCASTRAVHLKLCGDLTAKEFQRALKEFIARRGLPQIIISDNGKTFVATGKWLKVLKKDAFFERLIGIMKRSLSKSI